MLPSTGYFKAINCPFYENGYCERPYCHFRHSRRDGAISGASTSSAIISEPSQAASKPQNTSTSTITATNSDVIEQLVSEAVKKVLVGQNVTDTEKIVNKVVEGLKPKLVPAVLSTPSFSQKPVAPDPPVIGKHIGVPVIPTVKTNSNKCVYNPTPISELKKRHIPITAYEPSRESKAVKRKSPNDKPWMAVIRNIPIAKESKVSYTPTAISQTSSIERNSFHHNYIPTVKSESSFFNLYDVSTSSNDSYIPEKRKKKELYCPKPKKRREEYVPRKPKIPLKDNQQLEDDSYDVLDEILCVSESNPNIVIDDDSQDVVEVVDPQSSDDDDVIAIEENITKEEQLESKIISHVSHDEKENKELIKNNDINNESSVNSSNQVNNENSKIDIPVKHNQEDESKSKSKHSEKPNKEDSRHRHKEKDDLKSNKHRDENSKHSRSKEDDSKHNKNKDEDSKYIKNKDKERNEEKKDREKDKEKNREKEKHSSKSSKSDREHTSSSKDSKSKDKDRVKDGRGSSHRSKKESKSDKERSSNSKDSRDKKESKDKSKHKSDDKSKHKSKSSSSDSKSKSSKHSSDKHGSHSSHKASKLEEKPLEREDTVNDKNEEKSDQECKYDSPEYEEFSPFYDEQLLEDSDSDHDVEEECRKIFQEYEVPDCPKDVTSKAPPKPEVEESEEVHKKRVAHASATSSLTKSVGPSQPLKRMPNPQQRMYERWRLMKEVAAEKAAEKAASDHQVNGNGRIRIAQVPYAMSLALEKKKVLEQAAKVEIKTVAQNKKATRVAHIPQVVPQLIRPEPLQPSGTHKFSLNVRQFYVNAMQDICVQIYTNSDDAAQRALREEFACYEKCKALNVYKNSCMLTVHRLRKEVDQKSDELSGSVSGLVSHEAVLAGKVKGTWSVIKPKKSVTDFKGVSLYNMLSKWILTEQELKDNGYPRPHPDGPKGRAKLYVTNSKGKSIFSKVPNERYCCRCGKSYMVDKQGFAVRKENCIYHYARKFTFRGESKYMCCKQDASSDGCCDATTHVWDYVDIENLRGYVSTFDKDDSSADIQGTYALDCEMCYTTQGLELTRVTVINEDIKVVYEALVKPTHPIIDYNTRFSGINEADMTNVTTTLLDVQATLLSMFSSKTILVGHSLESDFKALKLLHNTVVDTSVMFPHKNGPPFKRALRNLCSEHLRKIIQANAGGHDSKEDAAACMELVLWKVKEEAKLQ